MIAFYTFIQFYSILLFYVSISFTMFFLVILDEYNPDIIIYKYLSVNAVISLFLMVGVCRQGL